MDKLVMQWEAYGYGFTLEDGYALTHIAWCDNIWLVSERIEDMQIIVQDLTEAVQSFGLTWKISSLEVMSG